MDELRVIAMASYQASSDHVQQLARNFFKVMDHDGNRKIDQKEFIKFMKEEGHSHMTNPNFFNQLDLDRNGTLDFDEVMMVYYIIQSGRPFCNLCKLFITSTYFTCVACLEDKDARPYYLCVACFRQRIDHRHNGSSRFVDNYSLLEHMTKSKLCELRSRPNASLAAQGNTNPAYNRPPAPVHNHRIEYNNYMSIQNIYYHPSPHHVQQPSASTALINPQPQRGRWKIALDALNAGVYAGYISTSLCTIL